MTKRIFKYISCFVFALFVIILAMSVSIFYVNAQSEVKKQLKTQTIMCAHGVEKSGGSFFEDFSMDGYRITWVNSDGKVLFDSVKDAETLDSHLDREEIKKAFKEGIGESSRYSDTIMSKQYYCAYLLKDGTVVRLSVSHESVVSILLKLIYPVLYSSLTIILISVVIAYTVSKLIVKPINEIDLDAPLKNRQYKEIQPLLVRIEEQQKSIRRHEKELERKQDEFNVITSGMKEGIILLGEDDKIISMNKTAKSLLDKGAEISALLDGSPFELDERTYRTEVTPIKDQGAVVLIQDVTDKEQAESMRREFTSNVSHELKTPLHSISGYAELLASGIVKEEDKQDFIERIYSESKRMITLVEDIISLSSLEENSEYVMERVDLWAAVRENVLALKPLADKAKIYVSAEGAPVCVSAVPRLLNVLIFNLVDNAIKYNKEQGSVQVTVKEEENKAVLMVKDTGIGIPYDEQQRVFERFYRVDKSRSKSVGGTGLGLSIVKHAAKIMNARIELISNVGEGTTMIVRFEKA